MESLQQCIDAVKDYCREHLVETTYNIFIKDIRAKSMTGTTAVLEVPSSFQKTMIDERYLKLLGEAFEAVLGFPLDITVSVRESVPEKEDDLIGRPASDEYYTFENFVVGPNNSYAHAMAKAVTEDPGRSYNPLFIYGNSGLGKTHLLRAIKNGIAAAHPDWHIIYVGAEQFTNDLITAIKDKNTVRFHEHYRTADVLLMDDIQFVGGKTSTEEELFHTFNVLHDANKQIVFTSDRPPKEIKSLAERLRTRFEWGITADIQPPDYETRVAIITSKAEEMNFQLPPDVVDYLAANIKNNIRQLEGAVKKISAHCTYDTIRQPTIKIAETAIKDIMSEEQPLPVKVDRIISEVSRTFDVSIEDIRSSKQDANISQARQVAMYVIRDVTGMTMKKIGEEFNGRNYATVVYGIKVISNAIRTDSTLRTAIEDIEKNCQSL